MSPTGFAVIEAFDPDDEITHSETLLMAIFIV
jgi:hypothetical protein